MASVIIYQPVDSAVAKVRRYEDDTEAHAVHKQIENAIRNTRGERSVVVFYGDIVYEPPTLLPLHEIEIEEKTDRDPVAAPATGREIR